LGSFFTTFGVINKLDVSLTIIGCSLKQAQPIQIGVTRKQRVY
jgi:hypothetical protein